MIYMELKKIIVEAIQIAKEAWKIALEFQKKWFETREKTSSVDLVTEADEFLDKYITQALKKLTPHRWVRSEENEEIPESLAWYIRIVDPIDGTYDFVHGWWW